MTNRKGVRVALLSCTKLKQTSGVWPASDLYMPSTLFAKARAYVESQNFDQWFILSAKYGLLHPYQSMVEPYNQTLNEMGVSERRSWSMAVFDSLLRQISGNSKEADGLSIEMDFFAGRHYRQFLIPELTKQGIVCRVPLEGKGIGEQLQFYTKSALVKNNGLPTPEEMESILTFS